MAIIYTQPEYPVVDNDPSFKTAWRAMRWSDYANMGLLGAVGLPVGYWAGAPGFKTKFAYFAAYIGVSAGVIIGLSSSTFRLMGFKENSVEVKKYIPEKPKDDKVVA
mmetsp:Transcript_16118/g.28240  ORF Transcript_16118/g.28240 Transcript_16118/m.28240 type:complete len:107 (-) Transcript_16118:189-509(-)|eukprot:CAMPEP_0184693400 /NCGR_PEP_ID=MMETSP0313-20130426/1636_1 /TAXON_ID=2792 /ORGANISM="Porphyridium aerugineum, Strain SAG 1380-2" /LENGTH=106 /DNA_ID=CAMNT_0027151475 /DNA_START=108 /DNA_END=428 /DNA_ORIENTATION=-